MTTEGGNPGCKYQQGITRFPCNSSTSALTRHPDSTENHRTIIIWSLQEKTTPSWDDFFFFQRRKSNQGHSHQLSFTTITAFQDFPKLRLLKWIRNLHYPMISAKYFNYFITFFFLACMRVMDRHASINLHFPGLPIGKEISNRNGTSDEVIVFCCRSWRASSNGLIFLHRLRQFQAFGYQGRSDFKPQPKWRSRFFFSGNYLSISRLSQIIFTWLTFLIVYYLELFFVSL